jgi:mannose-6-phosphate isomerase-like protein (cupin superfamily)
MPKGTIVRSSEVKLFVVDETYSSKMLIDSSNSATKNVQINQGFFAPGAKHADHAHSPEYDNDEVYLIIKGEGVVRLDGVESDVSTGDAVFIPAGTMHALSNKSQTEELIIFTVWSRQPVKGANDVYDGRIEKWGKSFVTVNEE